MLPLRLEMTCQIFFFLCLIACYNNVESIEGRVVCYYTNWSVYRPGTAKFSPQNINPYLCTHLVYAFGGFTKDNQMKPFDKYQDIEQGGYAKFTGLKTYNKQLKTMIAIGGWNEASSRFSPLVANEERRQQFINNILKFLRQNHFDGIDLDWEYPSHREGGKSHDRDNYAQFVQELREQFEREAMKTGRTRLLLTMAVPAGIEYIQKGYDVPKLNKYLDWFNVLTYDFHSSNEPSVNHHAPLYSLENDSEYNYDAELNIDYSIKFYLKAGADRDKLVLGIPTYGRSFTLINEESNELGAPSEGPGEQGEATREKGYLSYYEICHFLMADPKWTVVQPNANVMGPYAFKGNQWVGYDDEAIVRKKANYVVAHGLGGTMFWAIDNDDFRGACNGRPYPLIEAAKEAMEEAFRLNQNNLTSSPRKEMSYRNRSRGSTKVKISSKPKLSTSRKVTSQWPANVTTMIETSSTIETMGLSQYIASRSLSTPLPPTTPDPSSGFNCKDEGFFSHPRDCKKYFWCLDSGSNELGLVAHQFTCPSGLYFNPAADSCDFARNVPCNLKKSATKASTTERPTTNTIVTASPLTQPVPALFTNDNNNFTMNTNIDSAPVTIIDMTTYKHDTDDQLSNSSDAEEDPQVIKELIDLIRKAGGVEQLEKYLLQNKNVSLILNKNKASDATTTPSPISDSFYGRVLTRSKIVNTLHRNHLSSENLNAKDISLTTFETGCNDGLQKNCSKFSSVVHGNGRKRPQNEGSQRSEFNGFFKEPKLYVTVNRSRDNVNQDQTTDVYMKKDTDVSNEDNQSNMDANKTTLRPLRLVTPSYTSLQRLRQGSNKLPFFESDEIKEPPISNTQAKSYATISRGRTVGLSKIISSTRARKNNFERTPSVANSKTVNEGDLPNSDNVNETYKIHEEKNDNSQNTAIIKNTRKYASVGRRYNTATADSITTTSVIDTILKTETSTASTEIDSITFKNINSRNTTKTYINPTFKPASFKIQTYRITNQTNEPKAIDNFSQSLTKPTPKVSAIGSNLKITDPSSFANSIVVSHTPVLNNEFYDAKQVLFTTITTMNPPTELDFGSSIPFAEGEPKNFDKYPNYKNNHTDDVNSKITVQKQANYPSGSRNSNTKSISDKNINVKDGKDSNFNIDEAEVLRTLNSSLNNRQKTDSIRIIQNGKLKMTHLPISQSKNNSLGSTSSPRPFGYLRDRTRPVTYKSHANVTKNNTAYENDTEIHAENISNLYKAQSSQTDGSKVSAIISKKMLNFRTNVQQQSTLETKTSVTRTRNQFSLKLAGNLNSTVRNDITSYFSLSSKDITSKNRSRWRKRTSHIQSSQGRNNTFDSLGNIYKVIGKHIFNSSNLHLVDKENNNYERYAPYSSQIKGRNISQLIENDKNTKTVNTDYKIKIVPDASHDFLKAATSTEIKKSLKIIQSIDDSPGHTVQRNDLCFQNTTESNTFENQSYKIISTNGNDININCQIHNQSSIHNNGGVFISKDDVSKSMRGLGKPKKSQTVQHFRKIGQVLESNMKNYYMPLEIINNELNHTFQGRIMTHDFNINPENNSTENEMPHNNLRGSYRAYTKDDLSSLLSADAHKFTRLSNQAVPQRSKVTFNASTLIRQPIENVEKENKNHKTVRVNPLVNMGNHVYSRNEAVHAHTQHIHTVNKGNVVKRLSTKATIPRAMQANRGSVKFKSNDLSSLLALDLSSHGVRTIPAQRNMTVFRQREKTNKTIDHKNVKSFSKQTYSIQRGKPRIKKKLINLETEAESVHTGYELNKLTTIRASTTITEASNTVNGEKALRRVSTPKGHLPVFEKIPFRKAVASVEILTESQLPPLKSKLKFTPDSTLPTLGIDMTQTHTELTEVQKEVSKSDHTLSIPIYHRRKYYKYVNDTTVTYTNKYEHSAEDVNDQKSVLNNIHDVFNVVDNMTANCSSKEQIKI